MEKIEETCLDDYYVFLICDYSNTSIKNQKILERNGSKHLQKLRGVNWTSNPCFCSRFVPDDRKIAGGECNDRTIGISISSFSKDPRFEPRQTSTRASSYLFPFISKKCKKMDVARQIVGERREPKRGGGPSGKMARVGRCAACTRAAVNKFRFAAVDTVVYRACINNERTTCAYVRT